MLYIAASIATNCTYCTEAHVTLARRLGMSDEMLGELVEIVSLAHGASVLGAAYGVD
jgi:AhpD family alkylhydroperoxidase